MSFHGIAIATRPRVFGLGALTTPRGSGMFYAALVAAMIAPALFWPYPRTADLVMHWARLTIIGAAPDDPVAALYRVKFGLIPNLGIDLLYLVLAPVLSAESVARLAFALSIGLPAWGAWRLHRAVFATPSPTIWLAPLLSYNLATTGGLVNYAFGMGLVLLGLSVAVSADPRGWPRGGGAGWGGFPAVPAAPSDLAAASPVPSPTSRWARGLSAPQRSFARDLGVLNLVGVALFFCHLIALAAFVLLLALMRATPRPGERWTLALRRALLTPAYVAFALALVALREPTPAGYELDGSKMAMLSAPVASMTGGDLFALLGLFALAATALVQGLQIARPARLALAGFGLAVLAAPPAHGAANLIDARLTVLWAYFAVAVSSVKHPIALARSFAIAAVIFCAMRLNAVVPAWRDYNANIATMRAELRALPRGARALVVTPAGCRDGELPLISNLAAFATIDRRGFTNTVFAQAGMQPVSPRDPALQDAPTIAMDERWLTPQGLASLGAARTGAQWAPAFIDWRSHFDALIEMHGICPGGLSLPGLDRIASSPLAEIYRIDRSLSPGSASRDP